MKKLFIISSLLIFMFGCSANTYFTLKVYPCDAEIFAYITQADDNSYISILYLSDGIDFQLDNEEEYEKAYKETYKQIREEVAINLLEEGWTVEKIAMVLKEDVETVKKWLQQT